MFVRPSELRRRKALSLYNVYRRGLEEGQFSSMRNAGDWVASQPAPCYFIPAEKASLWVGMLEKGVLSRGNLSRCQRRKVRQLKAEYDRYMEGHPDCGLSRERIMEEIVEMPAPEFYMTGEAVRRILRGVIHEVRMKHGW